MEVGAYWDTETCPLQKEAEWWYDNDGIVSSPFITKKDIRKTSVSHNSLT